MNIREAVYHALRINGDKTSVPSLVREANRHTRKRVTPTTAQVYRSAWRGENNKQGNDCRTYATQDRRDMKDDRKIPRDSHEQLRAYYMESGLDADAIRAEAAIFSLCHSLPNLITFLENMAREAALVEPINGHLEMI